MPSTAAEILISLSPIVGIVMGCTVIFFFLLWNHQQRMLLIEKGLYKRTPFDLTIFSLFSGLILTSIGVSLVVFFFIKEGFSWGLFSGLIPLSLGASMLIFFVVRLVMNRDASGK